MSWIEEANLPDLPAIFQALSLNPEALEAVKGLNETLAFGGSTLSRVQEEAIATVVAVANQCRYGALTHGGFVRRHSGDSGLASQLLSDYTQAELPAPDLKMLDFRAEGNRGAGLHDRGRP
ncbi:MAG: carboxymuconolactone decarboxylase family protein [Dehalococcoidia bacterium]|nr:carboxymuconolactone decarboxylase family protein [Dehalococcoidia bacterium]